MLSSMMYDTLNLVDDVIIIDGISTNQLEIYFETATIACYLDCSK